MSSFVVTVPVVALGSVCSYISLWLDASGIRVHVDVARKSGTRYNGIHSLNN